MIGFFKTYRDGKRATRNELGDIAEQYKNWVTNRALKWDVPVLEVHDGRRDCFIDPYFRNAKPDQMVAIIRAREPGRILIANGNKKDDRWHLQMNPHWVNHYNFYLNDEADRGVHHGQLPQVVDLQSRDSLSVGQYRRRGQLAELAAVDEGFRMSLLQIQMVYRQGTGMRRHRDR